MSCTACGSDERPLFPMITSKKSVEITEQEVWFCSRHYALWSKFHKPRSFTAIEEDESASTTSSREHYINQMVDFLVLHGIRS